ncbi:MAG: lipoyl synthase [Gammaproteobacteria bacterium]|nr:lipoyl synthase [Gammaproteobacteria bacterium]
MQIKRKPPWLRVPLPNSEAFKHVKRLLKQYQLHSVCQEAKCPNITECFHSGTATFLILGDICTRNCRYCNVKHGKPLTLDQDEPARLVEAVKALGLKYVVITSVTRDDLSDGGATIFAECIQRLHKEIPGARVEVLIPDFRGNWQALDSVLCAKPEVLNHNIEVVKDLFPQIRPQGDYEISLELLKRARQAGLVTKSGFMIGVGESWDQILEVMQDLRKVNCQRLTIGQYLQPTKEHWLLERYYTPEEFDQLKKIAYDMGFVFVESGPLVRSSYHAALKD